MSFWARVFILTLSTTSAMAQEVTVAVPIERMIDIDMTESVAGAKRFDYAIGASLTSAPEYLGASGRKLSWRPVVAIRYGRFRLSSSGGSRVMNFGKLEQSSGASADLIGTARWKVKASLRINSGRNAGDSEDLQGIAPIDRTLLGRLSTTFVINPNWSVGTTVTWDLLNKGYGTTLSAGLGYRTRLSEWTEWSSNGALSFGNATHMKAYFGVPASAQTADRPQFTLGAGIERLNLTTGIMTRLSKHWVLFGNIGYSRVLGTAADSPLTTGRTAVIGSVGLAFRCCK